MKKQKLAIISLFGLLVLAGCGGKGSSPAPSGSTGSDSSVVVPDLANGVKNFAAAPGVERSEILRLLETYTLDNFLGGIPYRDNSGFVLYNNRLTIPADDYVVGYGYGVGEAKINSPLTATGITPAHNMYYHSWQSQDPGTINYLNAQDSVSADLHGLVAAGYYGTRFNADKTGYEWYPSLATTERPVGLNLDAATGMATKWRVPVKVGGDLKYDTLSAKTEVKAFKGQAVELDDYLTPFKLMLDNGWFRATDLGSRTSGFVGATEYLAADPSSRDFANVGIKLNVAEQAIEFEFNTPKTAFYAMYGLSSSLFSPIPAAFITAIGGPSNYGKPNIDSILSLGVYTLERWENSKEVVFKKNAGWIEADRFTHEGYKFTILENAAKAFQEFLDGKLDGAGVPGPRLQEFKGDPRARQTKGDTVWKLQVNAAEPEYWNELFGEEGSIVQGSEWDLKPVMSNKNFLNGMYFALDREDIAEKTGSRPAQAFLSEAYMVDPEGGLSWRGSDDGKAVVADRLPETNGFSVELAKAYFNDAMDELVAAGKYVRGTKTAPTKITLKLIFQDTDQATNEGGPLEALIEGAFNSGVEGFSLDIESYATSDWMDAYYAAMFGEFDMAFGSISGNTLDPIGFMDTVSSDNRSGFTLSWGTDTSVPSADLRFKDESYSFDALLVSATGQSVIKDGREATLFTVDAFDFTKSASEGGKLDFTASGTFYVEDAEYVISSDPDGTVDGLETAVAVTYFNDEGDFIGFNALDYATFAGGNWTVSGQDLEVPEGAYYVDLRFYHKHVYKGGDAAFKASIVELYFDDINPYEVA